VELCLENWSTSCPCGCILTYSDESHKSEYCNDAEDFKAFLLQFKDEIKRDEPIITANIDVNDIESSKIVEVITDIKNFIEVM
jgi:hypothetical protein